MKITANDLKYALPDLTTTMRLPELGATVEVYRDRCRIGNHQIADFPSYRAPAFESILLRM